MALVDSTTPSQNGCPKAIHHFADHSLPAARLGVTEWRSGAAVPGHWRNPREGFRPRGFQSLQRPVPGALAAPYPSFSWVVARDESTAGLGAAGIGPAAEPATAPPGVDGELGAAALGVGSADFTVTGAGGSDLAGGGAAGALLVVLAGAVSAFTGWGCWGWAANGFWVWSAVLAATGAADASGLAWGATGVAAALEAAGLAGALPVPLVTAPSVLAGDGGFWVAIGALWGDAPVVLGAAAPGLGGVTSGFGGVAAAVVWLAPAGAGTALGVFWGLSGDGLDPSVGTLAPAAASVARTS